MVGNWFEKWGRGWNEEWFLLLILTECIYTADSILLFNYLLKRHLCNHVFETWSPLHTWFPIASQPSLIQYLYTYCWLIYLLWLLGSICLLLKCNSTETVGFASPICWYSLNDLNSSWYGMDADYMLLSDIYRNLSRLNLYLE